MKGGGTRALLRSFERLPALSDTGRIAVAVSGGGDSMALLALMKEWGSGRNLSLAAVTVNHGIRAEGAQECALAAEFARSLGIGHRLLSWNPPAGGNLQAAARTARYRLISDWAKSENIDSVALAHTKDDQAETVLINLGRGSGIDGLCAMPDEIERHGILWLRPLLGVRRSELRRYLRERQISWAEDPSNRDRRFTRVKARQLIEQTSGLGLSVDRLAATASRMQEARSVLEAAADDAAQACAACNEFGGITFDGDFWELSADLRMRLAADALRAVSGSEYRPRFKSLAAALDRSRSGWVTLSGCILGPAEGGGLAVTREYAACGPAVRATEVWDRRWRIARPGPPGDAWIAALGPKAGRKPELTATPALWRGGELWAAPFVGLRPDWRFEFCRIGPRWKRFPRKS